jgi:NAD(P)-dependent dehydrogenase (short-subunit alcohol dehydrogenase family)
MQEKGFSQHSAYSLSKLAMMMITAEQAERLRQGPPTVNCLDPGTGLSPLLTDYIPYVSDPRSKKEYCLIVYAMQFRGNLGRCPPFAD